MAEYDFKAIEGKWQSKWFSEKAFEPVRGGKRKFFFTVPYPYVSGSLHVGHGRTYAIADVFVRFKRMNGFNVLWPMAFHITGSPVLAISSKIAGGDEETWRLYEDYVRVYEGADAVKVEKIVASFAKPWEVVNYFSKKLVQDFKGIGFSLDLSRQFTTGDPEYNRFIEWQFHKYAEKGYLTQASYPILYCASCQHAVGEDDIKDGDVSPVEVQRFVAVKSKFEDGFLVSCTLRPETVFGVTNLFVNPNEPIVKCVVDGEILFVSQPAVEKMRLQGKNVEVLKERKGADFIGKDCVTPLGVKVPILPASFVDVNNASGLVHSVPAHAPFDYAAIEELRKDEKTLAKYSGLKSKIEKIKPISLISLGGYGEFPAVELAQKMKIANTREKGKLEKATQQLYKEEFYKGRMKKGLGEFAGLTVAEAKEKVGAWLVKQNHAFEFFEASRSAECRCGGRVIAAVLENQWFLDFNAGNWKKDSSKALKQLKLIPEVYRKQFEDVIEWLDKRPCARRRGLGTQLPFANEWVIESLSDSTIYMAFYTVIKKIREHGLSFKQLTPEFFDFVFLGVGDAKQVAGSLGVTPEALSDIKAEFEYWYPNDQRHTAMAHVSNHLSFFIFAHTAVFPEKYWPKAISLNELVIAEGTKMSKSKGNVVSLNDINREYGADLFRLYAVGTADLSNTLDFRKKDVKAMHRTLSRMYAVLSELIELRKNTPKESGSNSAKWFLSKFASSFAKGSKALEEMRLRDYVQLSFFELLNNYDHFLKRSPPEDRAFVASKVALPWIQLLAPLIPHACEELWQNSGNKGFVSLSEWPAVPKDWIDESVEAQEDFVAGVSTDVKKILKVW
ncbi:MAG: leucine--tRNA ligase, partial [Candidatus Micrarchaeota archaeon]